MRTLVVDLTHGGDVIARRMLKRGEVTIVDCYRKRSVLTRVPEGAVVVPESPDERFDLIVKPVHCPDAFIGDAKADRVLTTHQLVGELIDPAGRTVEVTGARGKTSTSHILAHMASSVPGRMLLSTSRGIFLRDGEWTTEVERNTIAPTTLLTIDDHWKDFDLSVAEVSLGGSGRADVGVVTTIGDDYAIAKGARRAFDGKRTVLAGEGMAVFPASERDLWSPVTEREAITFGQGGDVEVRVDGYGYGEGATLLATVQGDEFTADVPGDFLAPAYGPSFEAALATAVALGIAPDEALSGLGDFHGVPGRAEVSVGDRVVVTDRNPGVSALSVDHLLRSMAPLGGKIGFVIEPVNRNVCEKLDMDALVRVLEEHGVREAYVTGERSRELPWVASPDDVDADVVLHCVKEGYK